MVVAPPQTRALLVGTVIETVGGRPEAWEKNISLAPKAINIRAKTTGTRRFLL